MHNTFHDIEELLGGCFEIVYLNYRSETISAGGMTEEKKIMRRKVLAKWLKESILRLGPTFIKLGQQFSTRVDILPQEYVDQLSELQVCELKLILIVDMPGAISFSFVKILQWLGGLLEELLSW